MATRIDSLAFQSVGGFVAELPTGPPDDIPWRDFHRVRNRVLEAVRPFGSVGPMGAAPMSGDRDGPNLDLWEREGGERPRYFVVSDQFTWKFQRVETHAWPSLSVVESLASVLVEYPDWSIGIAYGVDRYLFLTAAKIWVAGADLSPTCSLQEALAAPPS